MILHRYFAVRFAKSFGMVLGLFLVMMALLDLVEQIRSVGRSDAGFGQMLALTLLNLPQGIYRILPLILILASVTMFLGLARSSEMVVTRAAGRSAIRALMAPVAVTLIIGAISVAVVNPIVASTSKEYEARASRLTGTGAALAVSSDGLWLRQGTTDQQTVIRAQSANLDGTVLSGVTFMTFRMGAGPTRRIEAAEARLVAGAWEMTGTKIWPLAGVANPEAQATFEPAMSLPSTLTPEEIRDSFGTPSSISIWDLPRFIQQLQKAGFSAQRHQVWFQSELSLPVFLVAMLLIGAGFTMRHQRGGRTGIMVLMAVLLSFALYFVRNFALILGESGQLPITLAVWVPPLAAIGLAMGLILHLEDG